MKRLMIALWIGSLMTGAGFVSASEPVVLFDGKSLDKFDVIQCEAEIQEGSILLKAGNGLVQAKKQYVDFVLDFEWKALKDAGYDSGIYFRYSKVPEGRPWPKRYQVNLRHDMMGELGGFKETQGKTKTKAGQWNRFVLTVKGSTAALQVNGQPAWKVDGIENEGGLLAIQAEVPMGGQFLFRNVRVTDLSE